MFRPSELQFHSHPFYEVERGTTWRMAESELDRWGAVHVDMADRKEARFERGGFPIERLRTPGGEVPVRFSCSDTRCVLEAQRWYLASVGR